jgi:heme oxygenase (biliverdin-IX-beta and delta-forming)
MPLRNALRSSTSDCHADVDKIFGRFDLADPDDYKSFLSAHARIFPAVEKALEDAGIEKLIPDWRERRRSHLLLDDLIKAGGHVPPQLAAPSLSGDAALWGAAYVLEGSKLGGAMLARMVPADMPATYLTPAGPKGGMKAFMDRLDSADADESAAIEAAQTVFTLFRQAAETELKMAVS